MAIPTQTLTQDDLRIYAATRDHIFNEVADHVFSHDPMTAIFLNTTLGDFGGVRLKGAGNGNQSGGASVQIRVRLGKHAGSKWMAGPNDTHSVTQDDNLRLAQANWQHASNALVLTDTDKAIHQGPENMINFVADQTKSVMLALADDIGDALQATTSPANAITSLDTLIGAGAGEVQGLAGTTFTAYNSRGLSARGTAPASVSFASGSFAAQGIADFRTSFNNASEGNIQPTVGITTYATHERYEGALQPLERFAGAVNVADGSFNALAFRGRPIMASPKTPSGYFWWLRPGDDGITIKTLSGISFVFMPFKSATTQETHVSELQWKGQLVVVNRLYGSNKITGITD